MVLTSPWRPASAWAVPSGRKTSAEPLERRATPMTSTERPATSMREPTPRLFAFAYDELTTATLAVPSDEEKYEPAVTCEAVSGPTPLEEVCTPSTVKEAMSNDGRTVLVPPPAEPLAPPKPPPPVGNVPENDVSVSSRPPAAAVAPCSAATLLTSADGRVALPNASRRVSREKWVDGDRRLPPEPVGNPPKCCGPPDPAAAVLVTVMSVPTPSRPCRTWPWAVLTPAAVEETVTTRPMPTASPTATTMAWRRRRRSSLRR